MTGSIARVLCRLGRKLILLSQRLDPPPGFPNHALVVDDETLKGWADKTLVVTDFVTIFRRDGSHDS